MPSKDTKKPARPAHRPSVYPTKVKPRLKQIREATAKGATREEIAKICGVCPATIHKHANQFVELSEALRGGDAEACALVEAALFRRAMGYSHNAVRFISVSQGDGQGSVVEKHEYVEHYPPDTPAAALFLCNRAPERWKQKVEHAQDDEKPWIIEVVNYARPKAKPRA